MLNNFWNNQDNYVFCFVDTELIQSSNFFIFKCNIKVMFEISIWQLNFIKAHFIAYKLIFLQTLIWISQSLNCNYKKKKVWEGCMFLSWHDMSMKIGRIILARCVWLLLLIKFFEKYISTLCLTKFYKCFNTFINNKYALLVLLN